MNHRTYTLNVTKALQSFGWNLFDFKAVVDLTRTFDFRLE